MVNRRPLRNSVALLHAVEELHDLEPVPSEWEPIDNPAAAAHLLGVLAEVLCAARRRTQSTTSVTACRAWLGGYDGGCYHSNSLILFYLLVTEP